MLDVAGHTCGVTDNWNVLLHYFGSEGESIFHTLAGRADTYASVVTALMIHFIAKVNTVSECHWLYSMHEFMLKLQANILGFSIFHVVQNLVITQINYLGC